MKRGMKRAIAACLGAAVFCSAIRFSAKAADAFTDVPDNAWYRDFVYDLVEKDVIHGTSLTTFSPDSKLTRGAFAAMLANTVLSAEELEMYRFKGSFKDLPETHWANRYVNWAVEAGVVNGYEDSTFRADKPVSRQEMAVMVVKFANVTGRRMELVNEPADFADSSAVAKYAVSSVETCQRAGVINGYADGTFKPTGLASRAEAASLYSRFLKNCTTGNYQVTNKRVLGTAVRMVEFDSAEFEPQLVMGRDLVDGGESAASMIQRTGAYLAVNAGFFDMRSYLPLGTLIKEGRVLTVADQYAPEKPALVLDGEGKYSIQNFTTVHTITMHREIDPEAEPEDGEEEPETELVLKGITVNRWPSSEKDAARILYTRDWGHSLCFTAADAVTLDENGVILAVDQGKDVAIPETGYVLAQRSRREYEGEFFDSCRVGMQLEIRRVYEGAPTQDIKMSIGAGPRLVKDGAVYGDASTYRAEGFTDPNVISYNARRVCLGIKPDGRMVLLSAYTTLPHLSEILVSLGCSDGINFDGGGSVNLYVNGCWLYGPQSRSLNNMLCFTKKSAE